MKSEVKETILAIILAVAVVAMRFLPHPVNFSGTLALMIYVGHVGRRQKILWALAPLMILGSDYLLGFYDGISMVYAGYAFALLAGVLISRGRFVSFLFSGLLSSAVFFGLSNYGVWSFTNMYAHDQMGLVQCFVMALPFFHYTVISTVGGLAVMLALRTLVMRKSTAEAPARAF